MTSPLIPLQIVNPGFKGLNSQSSSTTLDFGWATELENSVFDLTGRVTTRKGWTKLTTAGSPGAHSIQSIHCYETTSGTSVVCAANNKLYSGTTTLTDRTGTTTPTANRIVTGKQIGRAHV